MAKHHKKAHKPVQEESKKVKILRILSAVSVFLPCVTYVLLVLWIFPARDSSFNLLGLIAAFFLGLSLYVLIRCADPAAFGFQISSAGFISLFFRGLGIILMVLTYLLLYVPKFYQRINEPAVHHYALLLGLLLLCGLAYWFFRMNVKAGLHIWGYSKTAIRKGLEGRKKWWYREFRKDIGILYPINLVLTISLVAGLILLFAIGWLTAAVPLMEWLVAFNLIGLAIALVASGFYSQFKLLEDRHSSDRFAIFVFFAFAGFLGYCAIRLF